MSCFRVSAVNAYEGVGDSAIELNGAVYLNGQGPGRGLRGNVESSKTKSIQLDMKEKSAGMRRGRIPVVVQRVVVLLIGASRQELLRKIS